MYSKVILLGRLVRDPESRSLSSGTTLTRCTLAINIKMRDKEETTFVPVEAWDKRAEMLAEYGSKGRMLLVEGSVRSNSWTDKESGQKRTQLFVRADNIRFLDSRKESAGTPATPPQPKKEEDDEFDIPF